MTILQAHFDGTSIVLDEPAELKPNTKVKVMVEPESNLKSDDSSQSKGTDLLSIFPKPVDMGIEDLSEQHDHYLYGTPKRK